jgi:hypothetical protein
MSDATGHYAYKKNGVMVSTPIVVTIDDTVDIGKFHGSYQYQISRGFEGLEQYEFVGDDISTVEGAGNSKFYYGIKVANDTGLIAFKNLVTSQSPYATSSNGIYSENKEVSTVIRNTNLTIASESKVTINFVSDGIRNILGFNHTSYSEHAVAGMFKAERALSLNSFNNDLVVEVSQLNVNTYDHTYKQLRNIVMVVTSGEVKKSITSTGSESFELSYTDAFPTYLSLGNPQTTLQIPQLSVRVTSEGSVLPMNGKISCVFLFKDENNTF